MPDAATAEPVVRPWTLDRLNEWNRILRLEQEVPGVRIAVANEMLRELGQNIVIRTPQDANMAMRRIVQQFLDSERYLEAAVFLLGRSYFDERSVLVKDVFHALSTYDRNSIPGASSVSKTFSVCIWHAMDWLRDPHNTAVRVSALSDTTLRNNIFNNLIHCCRSMVLDYGLIYGNLFIGIDPTNREGCISGITYPNDSQETGRFKGFKPISRDRPHPQFGNKTRVRLILEEASNMPDGVNQELNSMKASLGDSDTGRVKITAIFNPYNLSHWTADISAPERGITSLDIETSHQWESAKGWHVTRLDGKRCENVSQKKEVIACMLSHRVYREFELCGPSSVEWCCYARGFWPIAGSHHLLIPRYLLENRKVNVLFGGEVLNIACCDTAVVEDSIVIAPARWGRAVGVEWPDGRREMFDLTSPHPQRKKPKYILWIEPLIVVLPKRRDTMVVAEAIKTTCNALGVEPQWLAIDSTGSGIGIYDWLHNNFGNVLGIQWATSATQKPVLENSEQKPFDLYDRISSEMWFASKAWLEYDLVFFSPNFEEEPLFKQLTGRRLPLTEKSFRGKMRVETKAEYKGHSGGVSPGHADGFVMLQQLLRTRADSIPGMNPIADVRPKKRFVSVHTRDTINGVIEPVEPDEPNPTMNEWMQKQAGRY